MEADLTDLAENYVDSLSVLAGKLKERHNDCDSFLVAQGKHIGETYKDENDVERCKNCYRRIIYTTPEADRTLEERKNISIIHQPLDAFLIEEERGKEISLQRRSDDFCYGIKKLMFIEDADKLKKDVRQVLQNW